MQLKSLFNLETKSGHPLDAVKSAMQKYARRGMATEMLEAVSEIDALKAYNDSNNVNVQRAAKAVRTNMINRLKVILFEDVSFSQIGAFTTVCEKIKKWEDNGRTDENTLAEIVAIIAHAKKMRMPSYLFNWYGPHNELFFEKDDFLKFVKENEGVAMDKKDISILAWVYHHEEEAMKMLEDREFPGKKYILPMCKAEWKRLKPTKSKSGSKERFIFLVVPWLWILYADCLKEEEGADAPSFTKKEIAAAYNKRDVQFEDFVYDKHTKEGRKKGKTAKDFRAEGAIVYNEDSEWLAPHEWLKELYNEQCEADEKKKSEKEKAKKKVKPQDTIREIDLNVDDIELITEGVCGGKLPCGFVTINDKDKVIKPMTKGLNYGMDYLYIDKQKRLFGLKDLGMKMRKIAGKVLTVKYTEEEVKDKKGKKKIVKQRSYEWKDDKEGQVIAVMTKINVKSDLGKCKGLLKDERKFREMLKIRLFNGFFRTSDNIIRNILVDEDDELWAIDENDIYGKRKDVFNKKEPVKNSGFMTAELIESVIDELDFATHEQTLIDELPKYFSKASCKSYECQIKERVLNYKQIVLKELGF